MFFEIKFHIYYIVFFTKSVFWTATDTLLSVSDKDPVYLIKEANFKRCSLSFIANVNFNLLLLKLPSANKNPTQYQASKVFSSSLLISPQCYAFWLAAQLRHVELDLLALY